MATIKNNVLTEGLRGMIGDQLVFRRLRGKTVVSASPASPRKQSEQQRENRRRFRHAAKFAKYVMRDPEKKKYYWHKARTLGLPNAYTAALTDYMRKPVIKNVTVSKNKKAEKVVTVHASKKDFALSRVEVKIKNAQGVVVENGTAMRKNGEREWKYKPVIPLEEDLRVEIRVLDVMDNSVSWIAA